MTVQSNFSREVPLVADRTVLLFIDVQNFCAKREGGKCEGLNAEEVEAKYGYFFQTINSTTIPSMQRLQESFRAAAIEVMYTTIECLTKDGRDRSLDYKITGFLVPKGSWDGQVIDEIAPGDDEIVLPKSSASVFVSTHIDYILRNLGVQQLVVSGFLTDQCVESAVRDACDLGYLVTLVTDACATHTPERHNNSLNGIKGYCRQRTTQELINEITST